VDRQLFFCSTIISIGDGRNTPFGEARWLDGLAPKDLAPDLYQVARFKRRTMHTEMQNDSWIRNLQNISTTERMEEFILLFMAVSEVHLSNHRDEIQWKWTIDGCYIVALAYDCQFLGTMSRFPTKYLWKAKAEQKCRFFCLLGSS
jgi:hypothetical protein